MKHWILTLIILIAPMLRGADWPIFRGNRGLTGVAAGAVPDKPTVLWKFETKAPVKASAVVGDGRVYFGNDDGMFFALNLANGKKVWEEFKSLNKIENYAHKKLKSSYIYYLMQFFTFTLFKFGLNLEKYQEECCGIYLFDDYEMFIDNGRFLRDKFNKYQEDIFL